jgi:hypothetical protein
MLNQLKRSWTSLKHGDPGSRFQEQYRRQHRKQEGGVARAIRIVAGIILVPVGLFFLPAPGPGMVVLALGAILLARESRLVAQALDRLELRARQALRWLSRHRPRLAGRRSR